MTDIINKITGNFGIWQLRAVLIIYLCKIPSSWFMACVIFTAPAPYDNEYFCKSPSGTTAKNASLWIQSVRQTNSNEPVNHCQVYEEDTFQNFEVHPEVLNGSNESHKLSRRLVECTNFEHIADFYSLVMQFNLVCSREILVAWTQFWHLFGVLLGGIIATYLMNFFSPRRVMLTGMLAQIVSGCLTGLIDNFSLHCFFRTTSAICCALMFTSGQVIFSEITGGKYKTAVSTLFDQFWSIGVIFLPGLSSFFVSWTHIYLAITFPTVILIVLYRWIPDAPRWLLKRGEIKVVEKMLLQSAEINERNDAIPRNLTQELQTFAETLKSEPPPSSWCELWKGPRAKIHFVAAHIAWAVYITNFNGMLLNIRSFGREYLAVNTIITGLSEIVGCFLALHFILKTRNKWLCAGIYNIVAGIIGCLGWIFPDSLEGLARVCSWMVISSIAKAGVSISQSMLIACTAELVPPAKKQIFVFSCIVWARIWLLSAPFINVFKNIDTALSLSVFSLLSLIGGIATCCLRNEKSDREEHVKNRTGSNGCSTVWTVPDNLIEKTKF